MAMTKEEALIVLVRTMGTAMVRIGMPVGEPKDQLILGELLYVERACAEARQAIQAPVKATKPVKKGKSK